MENQQMFATFIDERTTSLISRVDEAEHKRSNEHIRRLRVGLKRWRTVYQLLTVLLPHHIGDSKAERPVHRLFKRAGTLRDFQRSRQLVAGLTLPPKLNGHLDHWLKKQEKKARKRLRKAIEAFHTKRIRKISRFIGDHSKAIRPARVRSKLHQLIKHEAHVIDILHRNNPSTEQLHSIRKSLKSLIELGNVLASVTQNNELLRPLEQAKRVQTRLGNWHDQVSLIEQLNRYLTKHATKFPAEETRSILKKAEKTLDRRTSRVRRNIGNLQQILPLLTARHQPV